MGFKWIIRNMRGKCFFDQLILQMLQLLNWCSVYLKFPGSFCCFGNPKYPIMVSLIPFLKTNKYLFTTIKVSLGCPRINQKKSFSKHASKNLIPFSRVMRTTLPPKPLLFTKIYKGFSKFIKEKYFQKYIQFFPLKLIC